MLKLELCSTSVAAATNINICFNPFDVYDPNIGTLH